MSTPRVSDEAGVSRTNLDEDEGPRALKFRAFTKESYQRLHEREIHLKATEIKRARHAQEAHLVDGELKFGAQDDEAELPPENPDLREGASFTKTYGTTPQHLLGMPIEEIDPGIREKTFVIVASRFRKKYIYRFTATKALFLLTPWNRLRRLMLRIATFQLFDVLIFLTIVINCVFLALPHLAISEKAEYVFLAIYTLECIIKVLARGFMMNKHTYLRDPWNWLDFVVIMTAYTTLLLQLSDPDKSVGNLQGLRTFRVLRALKTVSIVPGLKTIVNALLRAFKMLFEVILLTLFCLMVFAMFGLQVYMGVLRQKCVQNVTGYVNNSAQSIDYYYAEWIREPSHWYQSDDEYVVCGNATGAGDCPEGHFCLADVGDNPRYGYLNFDHFGWALLSCFQLITLDFWEDIYNKVIRATGPWNVIYFIVVIFFGSFYLINLMLAVVSMSYEEEAVSAGKEKEREKKENARNKHNAIYDVTYLQLKTKKVGEGAKGPTDSSQASPTAAKDSNISASTVTVTPQDENSSRSPTSEQPSTNGKVQETEFYTPTKFKKVQSVMSSSADEQQIQEQGGITIIKADTLLDPEIGALEGQVIDRNCDCCGRWMFCYITFLRLQNYFYVFVSDPLFDLTITFCIILNTAFMSLEHYNQPSSLTITLVVSNYIFTAVFIVEAVCKIIGLGKYYFMVGWNNFDLVIVIASILDLGLEQVDGLSVLRTFRLLRVFKLAQSWPTMRLLLTIILSTLGALGNLCLILGIVIYIFAVIGLQLFRTDYTTEKLGEEPRWHFKDFSHSMLMIFRVLCGEWIEPLYQCMRAADELCMVVFLPALVFGNFIVLNLFLALLLNAFASDSLDKQRESSVERSKLQEGFQRLRQLICCCCPRFNGKVEPSDSSEKNASEGDEDTQSSSKDGKAPQEEELEVELSTESSRDLMISFMQNKTNNANGTAKHNEIKTVASGKQKEPNSKATKAPATKEKDVESGGDKTRKPAGNKTVKKVKSKDSNTSSAGKGKKDKDNKKTDQAGSGVFDTLRRRVQFSSFRSAIENSNSNSNNNAQEKEASQEEETDTTYDDSSSGDEAGPPPDCFPNWLTSRFSCFSRCSDTSCAKYAMTVRIFVKKIVDHKIFESIVLFVILGSSLTLAFEDIYLYQKPDLEEALKMCNIVFAVLFTLEMVLKMIGLGFTEYLTSFWTVLDFVIVVISIMSLVGDSIGLGNITAFRSLRTLRALRPLRAISRWQGMKIVVNALMNAIPAIVNVFLVCMVFWLIFSIMGVQFFKGRFHKCTDPSTGEIYNNTYVPDRAACLAINGSWDNSNVNFDNAGIGFLALFQVATFEGWMEVMADAVDATEVASMICKSERLFQKPIFLALLTTAHIDEQPSFEASLASYLYFVIFIIFGSFFSLNLFIGVIIDNFNVLKKRYEGSYLDAFLTTSQRNYYNTLKKLGKKKPQKTIKRPKNKMQLFFYNLSVSSKFELSIVLLIFFNMVTMAVEHYKQPPSVAEGLDMMNILFTTVFTLEAIVKIIGLRLHYFRFVWNIFDFVIVVVSILGILLHDLLSNIFVTPTLLRVIRVFRIGRVLRLIKAAKGIRKLLFALIISLPAIFNIGALLFLIMYMYAIIGMSSFGHVKVNGVMDEITNFRTFGNSFMLLLRLATSAGWNDILDALLIKTPYCDPDFYTQPDGVQKASTTGDCGIPYLAIPFMVTYIIIVWLIVINMYIAVILENFNQAHEQEEVGITEDDFDMFYVVWEKYDPHATQFIKYEQLADFVNDLEPPLQIPKPNEIALVSFNIPIMEGEKMHCLDILIALVRNVLSDVEETDELTTLKSQMESKFAQNFPSRVNITVKSTTLQRKKEDVAARTLQRSWRSFKAQRAMRNITALAVQQRIRRASNVGMRTRTDVMRNLGTRLSNALQEFFQNRRGSISSQISSVTNVCSETQSLSRQPKIGLQLKVPNVFTLYPPGERGSMDL